MALTFSQLNAIATNTIDKTLTDNVYNATPILKRFSEKSKKVAGGLQIQVPLISSKPSGGGSYSDLDELDIGRTDNMSAAVFNWKQYYEPIRVSRLDLAKCSGDAAKLDLVASKIQIGESNMSDHLSSGFFSDGSGNSGKDMTGLGALLSATSTYGGIAPADLAQWKANIIANGGTDRAITLALIQKLDGACANGKNVLTLFVAAQLVYDEIYGLFTPFQRIESEDIAKLGFKSLVVNGKPLVVDAFAPAKTLIGLNENFVDLRIHKDNNMRKEHHSSLETTDSMLTKIFWMGNVGCSQRRSHGKITDIQVAA